MAQQWGVYGFDWLLEAHHQLDMKAVKPNKRVDVVEWAHNLRGMAGLGIGTPR